MAADKTDKAKAAPGTKMSCGRCRNEKTFPIRSLRHQLEDESERFFRNCLPKNWTCEKPPYDYGVDLRVQIFESGAATGMELLVQLKASQLAMPGDRERVRLPTKTYNHLWGKLQVAMLVKSVAEDKEAYWSFFRKIPAPDQATKTFSISIPKQNRLSKINWAEIQEYIRSVTSRKLASMNAYDINSTAKRKE